MTSKLTRERLEKIKSWRETYGAGSNVMLPAEEAEELACLALAAMDSEPVAEVYQTPNVGICAALGPSIRMLCALEPGTKLYLHAQPAPVVPGKWIPVSERMPEDEQEVLTINKMGHRFVSFFDKHSGLFFDRLDAPAACCIEHVLVTHWMPLPAAPQEVKGE
ncbi:TPA: DUF551 domain-containing protein [Klebsiella pneumoniae]|nr:DUF551 domain-containing protein [Klebsiella pneumoniae]